MRETAGRAGDWVRKSQAWGGEEHIRGEGTREGREAGAVMIWGGVDIVGVCGLAVKDSSPGFDTVVAGAVLSRLCLCASVSSSIKWEELAISPKPPGSVLRTKGVHVQCWELWPASAVAHCLFPVAAMLLA